jgi:hypothetical protein
MHRDIEAKKRKPTRRMYKTSIASTLLSIETMSSSGKSRIVAIRLVELIVIVMVNEVFRTVFQAAESGLHSRAIHRQSGINEGRCKSALFFDSGVLQIYTLICKCNLA